MQSRLTMAHVAMRDINAFSGVMIPRAISRCCPLTNHQITRQAERADTDAHHTAGPHAVLCRPVSALCRTAGVGVAAAAEWMPGIPARVPAPTGGGLPGGRKPSDGPQRGPTPHLARQAQSEQVPKAPQWRRHKSSCRVDCHAPQSTLGEHRVTKWRPSHLDLQRCRSGVVPKYPLGSRRTANVCVS
jgi:hypothetical protein